jgi:hypothetical protein
MKAIILQNGGLWELWVNSEVVFTHKNKSECYFYASDNDLSIDN